jgi:pilus assembly protein Flp/PilA
MLAVLTLIQNWVATRTDDSERGATMVEYGLLVALIAVFLVGAVGLLGTELSGLFTRAANALTP